MLVTVVLIVYGIFVLLAVLLFLPKIRQFFASKRLPAAKVATRKRRISIVIPARNESKVIGSLFKSILNQSYDPAFFEVHVIVQSKDDPTVAMAEKIGARVHVVPVQHCKGDALDGFFREDPKECDAYVIVDADAVLSPDYIEQCNNALEYDKQIFTTRKRVKNYLYGRRARSLVCNCSALIYPITDDLGNLYRAEKGLPLNFIGQGLMLRRDVILAMGGWGYHTLTEDFELKLDGFLRGFTSMYYPYAVLYTEEAVTRRESKKRRLRWLAGFSQCDRLYHDRVKEKMKRERADGSLKFDLFWFRIPIFLFLAATLVTILTGLIAAPFFWKSDPHQALMCLVFLVLLPIALTYLLLFLYGALAASRYRDAFGKLPVRERAATLLVFPFYTLEFVPIYLKSLRYADRCGEWQATERTEEEA